MITQRDGMYWPACDTKARPIILRDVERDVPALLKHIPGRNLILQAGGNVGVYALALADHFRKVVTAEPDPLNWECLILNLGARDSLNRVSARKCGFGEVAGTCDIVEVEPHNVGAHRVAFGPGAIDVWTIDDLCLPDCDAIWLDVEGAELPALKGAIHTIEQFSPVIAVEDKGLGKTFGVADGELQKWLCGLGYRLIERVGRDKIFTRKT